MVVGDPTDTGAQQVPNAMPACAGTGTAPGRCGTEAGIRDEERRDPPWPPAGPDDAPAGRAERMAEFAGVRGTVIGLPISALLWLLVYLAVRFLAG